MSSQLSWNNAKSFQQLAELTARWLEGHVADHPCCGDGGPDHETSEILSDLVALNRAGFMTDFSQPGAPILDGFGQRAAVSGFCDGTTAKRVAAIGLWTDLIVIAFPPGVGRGYYIPITIDDYHPFTWAGRHDPEDIDVYRASCGEHAVTDLETAWYVYVIDPQWGRSRYLWEHLTQVVVKNAQARFDITPVDATLETDFVW